MSPKATPFPIKIKFLAKTIYTSINLVEKATTNFGENKANYTVLFQPGNRIDNINVVIVSDCT